MESGLGDSCPLFFADCPLTTGFFKRAIDEVDVSKECPILRVKAFEFFGELKDFRFVLEATDGSGKSFRNLVLNRELTASVEKRKGLITEGVHVQLLQFEVIQRFHVNPSSPKDYPMILVSEILIGEEEIQAQNQPERPRPQKKALKRKMEPPQVITSTQFGSGCAGIHDELNSTMPESPIDVFIPETEDYSETQAETEAESGVHCGDTQTEEEIFTKETQVSTLVTFIDDEDEDYECSQLVDWCPQPVSLNSVKDAASDSSEESKETAGGAAENFEISIHLESAEMRDETFNFLKKVKGVTALQCK